MRRRMMSVCVASALVIAAALVAAPRVRAAVPHYLSVQGVLSDSGGNPISGSRNMTFRIYDAETAGNLLWNETQSVTLGTDGRYSVLLGTVTALDLPFTQDYWFSIEVETDSEMTPRYRIASSAYAYNAETVNGIPAEATPTANALLPLDGTGKFPNSVLNTGTSTGQLVVLEGSDQLPAVDGSQLTNVAAGNSDTVDGIHASATPAADQLLALDGTGKFPNSVLNVGTGANQLVALDGSNKLPAVDGSQLQNLPTEVSVPVGGVVAWLKSYTNTPALPGDFVECNGQVLSDPDSPYNGQTMPNLNASGTQRFLIGGTTSGATGGASSHNHQWAERTTGTGVRMTGQLITGGDYQQTWTSDGVGKTDMSSPTSHWTEGKSNLPPFYNVVWVMRIK